MDDELRERTPKFLPLLSRYLDIVVSAVVQNPFAFMERWTGGLVRAAVILVYLALNSMSKDCVTMTWL